MSNKEVAAQVKVGVFPSFGVYVSGGHVMYDGPRAQESIFNFI